MDRYIFRGDGRITDHLATGVLSTNLIPGEEREEEGFLFILRDCIQTAICASESV